MPKLHVLSAEQVEATVAWPKDQANPFGGGGVTAAANEEEVDDEEELDDEEESEMIPLLRARITSHEMHLEVER